MASVSKTARIGASAEAVWEVVRDFNGVAKWIGPVVESTMVGEGVGAIRSITRANSNSASTRRTISCCSESGGIGSGRRRKSLTLTP